MSWLERANPTVKMALLLVVSLATLFLLDVRVLLTLYLLGLVAAYGAARLDVRTLALAQVPFLLFAVGLVMVNAVSRPGEPLVEGSAVRVTVEGLVMGVALALRGMVIGVLTVAFLATTPPRDLMASLAQHARLSPRYAYSMLAGHRMLVAMPRRWATIRAAQAVRAPLGRDGRPRLGVRDFGRAAFTLLVGSVRASERIALAMESRGLSAGPRTVWRPVPVGRRDAVLAVVVLGTAVAVVVGGRLV
ncbi:energy-coupling factor transporter transmembrane protein EcfT [Xylanimonas oleitrophica]|uniref:Energy-coupling factor transporter transmembrane protein EcfT n=1 Tax=Xylanimonas oleitrophica TaxID=2607479 RepID=A0A2W5X3N3_9MICO|nr:energy-coupling factor transporter transmembrane component T [Xylanimonas oleitrophica]PZR55015.1 energy-coupling factor transporter transmembrane protein EcfT [Xylanimonas oleitrophica]